MHLGIFEYTLVHLDSKSGDIWVHLSKYGCWTHVDFERIRVHSEKPGYNIWGTRGKTGQSQTNRLGDLPRHHHHPEAEIHLNETEPRLTIIHLNTTPLVWGSCWWDLTSILNSRTVLNGIEPISNSSRLLRDSRRRNFE